MILGPLFALVVAAAAADPAIAAATPGRAEARDAAATATVDKPKIAMLYFGPKNDGRPMTAW